MNCDYVFSFWFKIEKGDKMSYLIDKQVLQFSVRTDVKSIVNSESNSKTRF